MTTQTINLRELAVEVDTLLASLYTAKQYHRKTAEYAADDIHRAAGNKRTGYDFLGRPTWDHDLSSALQDVIDLVATTKPWLQSSLDSYDKHQALIYQIEVEQSEAAAVYAEYEWNRAFLVTNTNGHVHNGMGCSTCFATTEYEWLVHYSAADEGEIVRDAGELACTVCYPTAPSDYLNRPANLVSKTRAEKDAAAAQRAAEKAEREAKRVAKAATLDGSDLIVPSTWDSGTERIRTEVTARQVWNRAHESWVNRFTPFEPEAKARLDARNQKYLDAEQAVEQALAVKHGVTVEEIREDLLARFAKRRRD